MKHLISLIAAFGLSASLLSAQDNIGIPADVFYLMPKMAQGTLLFRDKSPITGQFNICAVDNTVRFKDKGTELAMEEDESMLEVIIDGIPFLHRDGTFYRLYGIGQRQLLQAKTITKTLLRNLCNGLTFSKGEDIHRVAAAEGSLLQRNNTLG